MLRGSGLFAVGVPFAGFIAEDDASMANQRVETVEERLERLEKKVDDSGKELLAEMARLSARVYGVEDRMDAQNTRLDVSVDGLRGDIKLALERIDGLRQFMERNADEGQKERAADQRLLYALVRDHNRRLRAMERLERRQGNQTAPN